MFSKDEVLQLAVLEAFVDGLSTSARAHEFVLKPAYCSAHTTCTTQ
jgi:hypothetical protein